MPLCVSVCIHAVCRNFPLHKSFVAYFCGLENDKNETGTHLKLFGVWVV